MARRPCMIVSRIKRRMLRRQKKTSDQPAVKEAGISFALCCRTKRDASSEICCCSHFRLSSQSFFFFSLSLFIAGGNKPGPFCWGRPASPGHSSLFCFKRARLSSLSSLPCSPTPGAMLASAASSPGDWANVSWLHLAVFLWYGHITSAWAHVTLHLFLTLSSLLPSMFFLLLSSPFLSDVMICCNIFWQRCCHTFVSDNRAYYKISRSGQFSPTGDRER